MKAKSDHAPQGREDAKGRTRRTVGPLEVMVSAASMVVDQKLATTQVAAQLKIPSTTVADWVKRYRAGGRAAFEVRRRPSGYTQAGRGRLPRTEAPPVGNRGALAKADARRDAVLAVKREQPQAGSRRIRDVVRRFFGIGASETTVRRVLKAQASAEKRGPPRPKPKARERRFERAEPNQL